MSKNYISHKFKVPHQHSNVRLSVDTVDFKNMKSLTFTVKFWYEPETHIPNVEISVLFLECKHILNQFTDGVIFSKDYIGVKFLPEKIVSTPFFVSFEFTLYPQGFYRTRYKPLAFVLHTLTEKIYREVFKGRKTCRARKKKEEVLV